MDIDVRSERRLPSLNAAVRHHWALIAVVAVLAAAVGAAYSASFDRSYTASAIVLVNPVAANPLTPEAARGSGAQLTVALETEAEVVTTPSIAEGVSERLGRLVPSENDGEFLDVEVPTGTQMVQITFTSFSPVAASEGAQAFAEVYLAYRQERALTSMESLLTALQAEAEEIEGNLRTALSAAAGDSFAAREVDLYVDRLAVVNDQISTLESTMTDPGHVLQPAREPASSNELSVPVILGAAGVLGLGLGGLIAWYREWRSGLVSEETSSQVGGVPIFAAIPGVRSDDPSAGQQVVHEAYRQLRAGVVANALRPHSLAVCAIGDHEGAPAMASNLAFVLAEARYSVLLVAADPGNRAVERAVGLAERTQGLSDVLSGTVELKEVLVRHRGLTVLPGGRTPKEARELYAGPRFRQALDELRGDYDFIVLSSASADSADGDAITSTADSVLLVLTPRTSTHLQVAATLERFEHLGARTLGAASLAGGADAVHLESSVLASALQVRKTGVRA